jgi:hypothetical protein
MTSSRWGMSFLNTSNPAFARRKSPSQSIIPLTAQPQAEPRKPGSRAVSVSPTIPASVAPAE